MTKLYQFTQDNSLNVINVLSEGDKIHYVENLGYAISLQDAKDNRIKKLNKELEIATKQFQFDSRELNIAVEIVKNF